MSAYTPEVTGAGARAHVQRFGAFLAGMIMPNLGAFIAWGLITALFISNGWVNLIYRAVEGLPASSTKTLAFADQASTVVVPIIVFLLPILIGYTGGRQVHGQRGAVVGAIGTIGVVVAPLALGLAPNGGTVPKTLSDLGPQFLGALIMGPLTAWVLKHWDQLVDGRLKAGFEMLVDNFSAGIIGGALSLLGLFVLGPIVLWINNALAAVVDFLITNGILPLSAIIIEPAKVLFLNNAIGNGILVPLGATQAKATGSSILFMLESNPGPGLGILLAMMLFGPRAVRPTVPSAIVVQFLGGIHEIYFPYVLMKPILVVAAIFGGAVGTATFAITGSGLRSPASPGSIIAYILVAPPDKLLFILLGILLSAATSFAVGSVLLGFGRRETATEMDLDEAQAKSERNKGPAPATA